MKRIGCDVDGVIFNTIPMYIDAINRLLDTAYHTVDLLNEYSLEQGLGISEEIAETAITSALSTGEYPCIPGARLLNGILQYEGIFEIPTFISARSGLFWLLTRRALVREYGENLILYCHDDWKKKSNLVRQDGLDYFIEDSLHHAIDIVFNTDCKVFLLNTTYNQETPEFRAEDVQALTEGGAITRVNNWIEIAVLISRDLEGEKEDD